MASIEYEAFSPVLIKVALEGFSAGQEAINKKQIPNSLLKKRVPKNTEV